MCSWSPWAESSQPPLALWCGLESSEIQFFLHPTWTCSILVEVPLHPVLLSEDLDQLVSISLYQSYTYVEKLSKPYTVFSISRLRYHNSNHMTSVQTVHLSPFYSHFLALSQRPGFSSFSHCLTAWPVSPLHTRLPPHVLQSLSSPVKTDVSTHLCGNRLPVSCLKARGLCGHPKYLMLSLTSCA